MLTKTIRYFIDLFYPLFRRVLPFQLYAYLAVGALNTALNIALFALFYQYVLPQPGVTIAGVLIESYTISLLLAFILTIPTGFWLAKQFAFNQGAGTATGKSRTAGQLIKYFLVVLQGLGSDYLILKALVVFFDMHPTVAKLISTVVVLTLNYLLQKYFTFNVKAVETV